MPAETEPETKTAKPSVTQLREQRIRAALTRFRVIAYIVGVGLLALTVATILDWGFGIPQYAAVIGPLHGFLYMIYLALGIDLALKARWSIVGSVLVLLAGTIPFLSFVAERQVTKRVLAGRKL